MATVFQITAFAVFSFIAIAGALGMTTTMSMFRSGIFLMASFFGVAGLFILLSADLIGILQIMMYVGGMLVMILFMVLFMHDPGGAMMAGMEGMAPLERWFSKGLVPRQNEASQQQQEDRDSGDSKRPDAVHHQRHHEHEHANRSRADADKMEHMSMEDMSMVTPVRPLAAWLAITVGVLLVGLLLLRPNWHIMGGMPNPDSARQVGHLLMEKYMVAFEGAGVLILIGIFGAVLLARPSAYPDDPSRNARVAIDEKPLAIESDRLAPLAFTTGDSQDGRT